MGPGVDVVREKHACARCESGETVGRVSTRQATIISRALACSSRSVMPLSGQRSARSLVTE